MEFTDIWSLADAELNNVRAILQKHPKEQEFIDRLISLYKNLPDNFIKEYPRERIPILQMFWTSFRGFLISTEMTLQGHISESYAITSKSAESLAIAQKFNLYPDKIEVWVRKNKDDSQTFRRLIGTLFPENDPVLQPKVFNMYDLTSEYGRHPNFATTAFYSNFEQINTDNKVLFTFNDFEDELNLKRAINYNIFAYQSLLIGYSVIFKEFLKSEYKLTLDTFNTDFEKYKYTLREEFSL